MVYKTAAMPKATCELLQAAKENAMKRLNSPTISVEEAHATLHFLFELYLYEKENSKDFAPIKQNSVDQKLHFGSHLLRQLAMSHGKPCQPLFQEK